MNKKKEDKEEKSFITLTIGEKSDVLLVGQLDFDKLANRVEKIENLYWRKALLEKKTGKDPENEWIRDLTLLPKKNVDVLVKLTKNPLIYIGYYSNVSKEWFIDKCGEYLKTDEVKAWQLIPRFK